MRQTQRRLRALEAGRQTESSVPAYLCVATEADIEPALAALGPGHGFVKLYVGIDIDAMWDTDNENRAEIEGA